ncbi:TetR/AcrR family transcriptional regulator [Streptomyces sp. YC504]|uniref:TetR/AcrR family transcriptional regulator n=1 Tax=Streptomyces mesophilus TaxID=1775132 RepID=A0A6G4XAM2_9ACTN|nr:TetR/AcrR family transcriptional regulator [Streptomyces mesophilus]NGO74202.1 TetR/AcrR family transcriptional regulator [Streptomyces mesophilus]
MTDSEGRAATQTEGTRRKTARRPPDRKARIVSAAAELFRDRGYHNVSLADVATAVGITAPALYRHFRGKPDLLLHVVDSTVAAVATSVAAAPDLDAYLRASASETQDRRGSAVLWQREARHLPDDRRKEQRHALNGVAERIGGLIHTARPELDHADRQLLAWAILAVYGSVSWHRASLPRRRFEDLLYRLAYAAAHCQLGTSTAPESEPLSGGYAGLAVSRREAILVEAIRLFDERGFQSVSTDDIGEATGTTGPSIYKHFPTKTDLLVAAVVRGGEQRRAGTAQALSRPGTPRETLQRLLRSYVEFAVDQSHLIGLLIGELDQLPDKERKAARQTQREYLGLWVQLLDEVRPGLDPAEARITVGAVLTIIDNAARTGAAGDRPDLADRLTEIGAAVLLAGSPGEPA